jgi:hypothetical protein
MASFRKNRHLLHSKSAKKSKPLAPWTKTMVRSKSTNGFVSQKSVTAPQHAAQTPPPASELDTTGFVSQKPASPPLQVHMDRSKSTNGFVSQKPLTPAKHSAQMKSRHPTRTASFRKNRPSLGSCHELTCPSHEQMCNWYELICRLRGRVALELAVMRAFARYQSSLNPSCAWRG